MLGLRECLGKYEACIHRQPQQRFTAQNSKAITIFKFWGKAIGT